MTKIQIILFLLGAISSGVSGEFDLFFQKTFGPGQGTYEYEFSDQAPNNLNFPENQNNQNYVNIGANVASYPGNAGFPGQPGKPGQDGDPGQPGGAGQPGTAGGAGGPGQPGNPGQPGGAGGAGGAGGVGGAGGYGGAGGGTSPYNPNPYENYYYFYPYNYLSHPLYPFPYGYGQIGYSPYQGYNYPYYYPYYPGYSHYPGYNYGNYPQVEAAPAIVPLESAPVSQSAEAPEPTKVPLSDPVP